MSLVLSPRGPLRGELRPPGDKSLSHRSLLINALATGDARVRGLLRGEDVLGTLRAVRALGVQVDDDGTDVIVRGTGTLSEPADVIDCGNSGTTARLLLGVLAAESFSAVLTGDGSLRGRPMGRVARPLRALGARIDGRKDGTLLPIAVRGPVSTGGRVELDVASAQVKTALLLAARRHGIAVREPETSRDHTERMLRRMGAALEVADGWVTLAPTERLDPLDVDVPADLSSAAFWLVAASIVPGSELVLRNVGINPTRTGVLDALLAMGADITVEPVDAKGAEPVADLVVRYRGLRGARIDGALALRALDELPVLSVAAAFAHGTTTIADAAELRVKESDRIARVVMGLRALGVAVEERPDGMVIEGGGAQGPAQVDCKGDHRLAMSFAVAGLAAPGQVELTAAEEMRTSYPTFLNDLARLVA